mmetsp:Transcript_17291/g.38304  ORF Transcript_17291/g.38304 Transcript_17291/m.38304 type:complete len:91 (-) Transcript_17291:250-522(-)
MIKIDRNRCTAAQQSKKNCRTCVTPRRPLLVKRSKRPCSAMQKVSPQLGMQLGIQQLLDAVGSSEREPAIGRLRVLQQRLLGGSRFPLRQ